MVGPDVNPQTLYAHMNIPEAHTIFQQVCGKWVAQAMDTYYSTLSVLREEPKYIPAEIGTAGSRREDGELPLHLLQCC